MIQGKCILVVKSALYCMFWAYNLRNQYVIGRTNENKLPFVNTLECFYNSADIWVFGKLIQHYWYLLAEVVYSKNSSQRNQMALEVIQNYSAAVRFSEKKFWPEKFKKLNLKWYFPCSAFILFYSTIDRYMRGVSYLWQHMRVHTTYSWNIKWQKCAGMDLNGFIFKKNKW